MVSLFVHNDAFIALNANPPRWELCLLPPIHIDSFNGSIRVHPPLVLWSMDLSLPVSKFHHLFTMSVEAVCKGVIKKRKKRNKQERQTLILLWYLDNSSIWKNAFLSTIGVENLDGAIWEGYFPCAIRMVCF